MNSTVATKNGGINVSFLLAATELPYEPTIAPFRKIKNPSGGYLVEEVEAALADFHYLHVEGCETMVEIRDLEAYEDSDSPLRMEVYLVVAVDADTWSDSVTQETRERIEGINGRYLLFINSDRSRESSRATLEKIGCNEVATSVRPYIPKPTQRFWELKDSGLLPPHNSNEPHDESDEDESVTVATTCPEDE